MDRKKQPTEFQANMFHTGNTCPFCQESIDEGQLIVTCNDCGSIHHGNCWNHQKGCSSYHCDTESARANARIAEPDIMITAADLENVVVPPVLQHRPAEDVAKEFVAERPNRLSILAVVSVGMCIMSGIGVVGVVLGNTPILVSGMALTIVTLVIGVLALVRVNYNRRISGILPSTVSILMSGCLLIFYLAIAGMQSKQSLGIDAVRFRMNNMVSEEHLKNVPPAKANCIRANVVIQCRSAQSFFNQRVYLGSGVITQFKERRVYILTNKHVIEPALSDSSDATITVLMYNGEESVATVEWQAPGDVDAAIISCPALTYNNVNAIQLMTDTVSIGQKVFAVGNPHDLFWTYTEGVISSVRTNETSGKDIVIYQTQTPVNHGNSGGGLFSMDGLLLGIVTWTHDKSVAEGLSFAISSKSIKDLMGDRKSEFLAPPVPLSDAQTDTPADDAADAGEAPMEEESPTP